MNKPVIFEHTDGIKERISEEQLDIWLKSSERTRCEFCGYIDCVYDLIGCEKSLIKESKRLKAGERFC